MPVRPADQGRWKGGALLANTPRACRESLLLVVGCLCAIITARAGIIVPAFDSGTYNASGFHLAANKSYTTGIAGGVENRSYFVFSIPVLPAQLVSAVLELENPVNGYRSPDPMETLQIFEVSTPLAMLQATNFGAIAIFADLGTGTPYAFRTVSAADNNTLINIPLNAAALAAITGAAGGSLAFGGALTSLAGVTDEFVFGFTGTGSPIRRLELTFVPEPAVAGPLSAALFAFGLAVWKRHRARREQ